MSANRLLAIAAIVLAVASYFTHGRSDLVFSVGVAAV